MTEEERKQWKEYKENVVEELERRKSALKALGCPNIDAYNEIAERPLQRLIFACDEVAEVLDKTGLSKEQKEQVEKKLLETTNYVSFEMHYEVDTALIGGMVIRMGDRVVDSSIRTKLSELQRELLKVQVS